MSLLSNGIAALWSDDDGATMVEYGLMLALVAVVCAIAVKTLGTNVNTGFKAGSDCVAAPGTGNCP
jgi:pilus assembly protein Flp/PilA